MRIKREVTCFTDGRPVLTLSQALDAVYGNEDWTNPIRPWSVSSVTDTPYEAFGKLLPTFKPIVTRLIGHPPKATDE